MSENNIIDLENMIEQFILFRNKAGQLTKETDKNSYRRAIEKGWSYFSQKEIQLGRDDVSKEMLTDFRRHLIGTERMADRTAGNYMSRFMVFYKWLLDQKQERLFNEEYKEGDFFMKPNSQTQAKQSTPSNRKVSFNLDYTKFVKLSALALTATDGKTTLTDLISAAIDDFLAKHSKELDDIKRNGLF